MINRLGGDDLPRLFQLLSAAGSVDERERYLHWDQVRHRKPPEGFTSEEHWAGIKFARSKTYSVLPYQSEDDRPFLYCLPGPVQEKLHWLDLNAAGVLSADDTVDKSGLRNTYLMNSLAEEAISSSQLEGAATTREVAREMIRQDRSPQDADERMILNNYHAMNFVREYKSDPLSVDMILELHEIVVRETTQADIVGRLRTTVDSVHVVDNSSGDYLFTPPSAEGLEKRLETLCRFANGQVVGEFIHPLIKAIVLHFLLAYEHPFVDGNGRTARALFYWFMLKEGYWLMEFVTISRIIKRSPRSYGMAFLYTETDSNDVTYFIIHQLSVIKTAVDELKEYLERKKQEIEETRSLLFKNTRFGDSYNPRQLALLRHALKHPGFVYSINEHKNSHGITHETARRDLIPLVDHGYLLREKVGRNLRFRVVDNLPALIGGSRKAKNR